MKSSKVKYLRHYKSIIIICSVNLSLLFIYKFCKKQIHLQPPGEPREHCLGGSCLQGVYKEGRNQYLISYCLFVSKSFVIYLQFNFEICQNQITGEPRDHYLDEALQERSKSKFNITLSYSIVLFF